MSIKKTTPTDSDILQHARDNRHSQTPAEAKLWQLLRNHNLDGLKFRRQHPVGRYIVDFYCHEARLVVELDGRSHDAQMEYDEARTEWLAAQGYRVLRFSNQVVMQEAARVAEVIRAACREEPSPGGEGTLIPLPVGGVRGGSSPGNSPLPWGEGTRAPSP